MTTAPRILVMTVVHHPQDARIAHREIKALLDAGFDVTYAAPFSAYGVEPPRDVRPIDLRRSHGRRRLRALVLAALVARREARNHDIVLVHDPELVIAAMSIRGAEVVWDVHEDFAGAITSRTWVPRWLTVPLRAVIRSIQHFAERRFHVILAEDGYVPIFRRRHLVVPNSSWVPPEPPALEAGKPRIVYLGALTASRGAHTLLEVAELLDGIARVDVYGPAHEGLEESFRAADQAGILRWHGFTPNAEALRAIEGAALGISLVRDEPNYRHSRLTKLMEYLARGVPIVTTPLPVARQLVEDSDGGILVPFDDAAATVEAIAAILADPTRREHMARNGHAYVLEHHNWELDQHDFVNAMRDIVTNKT